MPRTAFLCLFFCVTLLVVGTSVEECCCDSSVLDQHYGSLNEAFKQVSNFTFFRIFKLDLYSDDCPLDQGPQACGSNGCAVCDECEVPPLFQQADEEGMRRRAAVDLFVGSHAPWVPNNDDMWIAPDADDKRIYIDLGRNPEKDTGYVGDGPRRMWQAIYSNNCFTKGLDEMCVEERALYRVTSGFHLMTNLHVAHDKGFVYDLQQFPDRLGNLYFATALMLRALAKARQMLLSFDTRAGVSEQEDRMAQQKLEQLLGHPMLQDCSDTSLFNERALFTDQVKKNELRQVFREISRIMNCVDCDTCRLHGKLQFLGIGTAMKVLWSHDVPLAEDFERDEVSALIYAASKFTNAVEIANWMATEIERRRKPWYQNRTLQIAFSGASVLLLCVLYRCCGRRESKHSKPCQGKTVPFSENLESKHSKKAKDKENDTKKTN
ncbi:MAG: hypothetical protein MHM6MM_004025 [Cercozoa sp. M6MM]